MEEEENYSPYCKNCDSCGESGCCSPLNCAYDSMVKNQDKNCDYGESYYRDIEINYKLADKLYNLIMEQPDLFIDMKILKGKAEAIYDELLDSYDE